MRRLGYLWFLGVLAALVAAPGLSGALFAQNSPLTQYQVLNPWAEVDPMPLRGLSAPRLPDLAGKKVGLFVNSKRAAQPIAMALEKRLRAMYPDMEITFFNSLEKNVLETETKNKDKFAAWVKSVDAVILEVGD
jgi:hypothetical protein